MTENLANGHSSESAQRELSNEYQYDRAGMVFKGFNTIHVLRTKVASALHGLRAQTESNLFSQLIPDLKAPQTKELFQCSAIYLPLHFLGYQHFNQYLYIHVIIEKLQILTVAVGENMVENVL